MKKSLILSTIMTLVLIVAMSTATFAWYTSNSSVQGTGMQLTASTAAGNVTIGHTAQTATHTAISWVTKAQNDEENPDNTATAVQNTTPASPMMPTSATLAGFATGVKAADGTITYTPGVPCSQYNFYLSNLNSDGLTLTVSANIVNDTTGDFRWAIVAKVDDVDTIISTSGFNYLTSTSSTKTDAIDTVDPKTGTFDLDKNANGVEFTVYVWFSGDSMTNADSGKSAGLNISITVPQPAQG